MTPWVVITDYRHTDIHNYILDVHSLSRVHISAVISSPNLEFLAITTSAPHGSPFLHRCTALPGASHFQVRATIARVETPHTKTDTCMMRCSLPHSMQDVADRADPDPIGTTPFGVKMRLALQTISRAAWGSSNTLVRNTKFEHFTSVEVVKHAAAVDKDLEVQAVHTAQNAKSLYATFSERPY